MLFVFMSQPDFSCNPYALWTYITENTDYDTAWIVKRDNRYEALKERNIRCAIYNTLEGQKLIQEADYVITNSYTFLDLPKSKNQIFVNLWHGSGVKAHDFYNHDMDPKHANKLRKFFDKIDMMCVHSLDDRFRLSAQLNYDMRKSYVTGQPRLDIVKISDGKSKLRKLYGETITKFDRFIFYAPSFRANMSSHSGQIYSENIFRLNDYCDEEMNDLLIKNNAALIYKLHPVEQTAFQGRKFRLNARCLELTDDMLFDADLRYTEILNAFDVMISDYSSIAYDYLLLNRPVVYLIPDYEEYISERGFVFHNINDYMPGDKVYNFDEMLTALRDAFATPDKHIEARNFVLSQRFDYKDNLASKRCYQAIMNYKPITDFLEIKEFAYQNKRNSMPTVAEQLQKYIPENKLMVDCTRVYTDDEKAEIINSEKEIVYITSEIPNQYRRLTGQSSIEIADLELYFTVEKKENSRLYFVEGGVDFDKFSKTTTIVNKNKRTIGFAGTIDNRIYFSMVQCICEVFCDYDIIFAGNIFKDFPIWLNGFENLHYIEASYNELPEIIQTFDVAILPFFGKHKKTCPSEFYQYIAAGKQVITSDMPNIPLCEGVYVSSSVSEVIDNINKALLYTEDIQLKDKLQGIARKYDWKEIAGNLHIV
jgi:CDP-glycerol glycerophosphotransferase (TagB/SpsB family)